MWLTNCNSKPKHTEAARKADSHVSGNFEGIIKPGWLEEEEILYACPIHSKAGADPGWGITLSDSLLTYSVSRFNVSSESDYTYLTRGLFTNENTSVVNYI